MRAQGNNQAVYPVIRHIGGVHKEITIIHNRDFLLFKEVVYPVRLGCIDFQPMSVAAFSGAAFWAVSDSSATGMFRGRKYSSSIPELNAQDFEGAHGLSAAAPGAQVPGMAFKPQLDRLHNAPFHPPAALYNNQKK
mgnify:CR=1 FL=1